MAVSGRLRGMARRRRLRAARHARLAFAEVIGLRRLRVGGRRQRDGGASGRDENRELHGNGLRSDEANEHSAIAPCAPFRSPAPNDL
ncbi:hypothetical protein X997_4989 [Burkholderia pseudomallei A79C]|nr:hypothetical protein X997_4989 [Burkholderia pseudomallei A79C]